MAIVSVVPKQLRTIVVDLTPVLPGGENGGAKVFILELLRRLSEHAPQTQFVLLTQAASHEELAALDAANMRRVMVLDHANPPIVRRLGTRLTNAVLRRLPGRSKRVLQRTINQLRPMLRAPSQSVIRGLKADLLFCPFTAPTYFEIGVPTVSIIYDLQYKTYPEFFPEAEIAQRDRTFVEAMRRSTALVAISEYTRQAVIRHGGVDPALIKTIHLQVSQHILHVAAGDESILARLQLAAGQYLIYPANFWKHKNHEMLLTAFGIARRNGLDADIRLVCTGAPGERQRWLKRAAEALGLGDHVLFPGYLADAELLALITASAGMIFPSLYEGFGLPVIEAMATGTPVACSNVTSLPEVAGDAAILFDPRKPDDIAKAMISLASDKALTARMVESGRERAKQFSRSELMAEQYLDVFKLAVGLEHGSDILIGVHPDGWMGPTLALQFSASTLTRTVNFEIAIPEWVPIKNITTSFLRRDKQFKKQAISRGASTIVSIPLPPEGGHFDVNIAPTFIPAQNGHGGDNRDLSAILVRCYIEGANAERIVLYPEALAI
ncbi:glycosyltransferase involved in cell wall biosynthesis [Nitrobacteraceae bacterium AZCC 2161]